MASPLELTLLYLLAAVAGVVVCRLAQLPPMLGYLAVGVRHRPERAGARAATPTASRYLAEFGVVFLMFVIGLEFNLPKLRSMRKLVFGLGLSQVVLTMLAAVAGNAAAGLAVAPRAAAPGASAGRARSRSAARWR